MNLCEWCSTPWTADTARAVCPVRKPNGMQHVWKDAKLPAPAPVATPQTKGLCKWCSVPWCAVTVNAVCLVRQPQGMSHVWENDHPVVTPDKFGEFFTCWAKVDIPGRPDFVGVRTRPDGRREFLTHNNAMVYPYYLTVEGVPPVATGEAKLPLDAPTPQAFEQVMSDEEADAFTAAKMALVPMLVGDDDELTPQVASEGQECELYRVYEVKAHVDHVGYFEQVEATLDELSDLGIRVDWAQKPEAGKAEGVGLPPLNANGHGYPNCECDLVGGDEDCKIEPPYVSSYDQRCMQLLAALSRNAELEKKLGEEGGKL